MYPQATKLRLCIKQELGKPILSEVFFTPPLKILDPIYEIKHQSTTQNHDSNPHKEYMLVIMLLSVSAGMMSKDKQDIILRIEKNSHLRIISQSFEKIHKMPLQDKNAFASRITQIYVDSYARLDYAPLPCIPFRDSRFFAETEIFLHTQSQLYYSEIFTAGRVGMGEKFAFDIFSSKLRIFINNQLQIADTMVLEPKIYGNQTLTQFHDFTHYLSLFIIDHHVTQEMIEHILESFIHNNAICIGVSTLNSPSSFCIKALCNRSDLLLELRDKLLFE